MGRIDIYTSVFLMLLGLAICANSYKLSLWSRTGPGLGFVSFLAGSLIFLLSLHLFLKNLFFSKSELKKKVLFKNWNLIIQVVCVLIFYALFFERLGFILDLFIVISLLFAISKTIKKWYVIIGISIFISFASYIVFSVLLGIGLPLGVLSFLR